MGSATAGVEFRFEKRRAFVACRHGMRALPKALNYRSAQRGVICSTVDQHFVRDPCMSGFKHQAERSARQQLQLLADIHGAAVAYLDRDRCFDLTNTAFKKRFGEPECGTRASDFFEGVCSPAVDNYLRTAIERGEALSARLDCADQCGDTERLHLQAVPHLVEDHIRGVFLLFDNVETRAIEVYDHSDGSGEQERLANLQRMAKLGEMAAGLAHEIRQPLAAISNYTNALVRMSGLWQGNDNARSIVEQIGEQVQRADRIVANVRDMIGQSHSETRAFDICRVVDSSLELIERRARELNVDVRLSVPSAFPVVHGNPAQIEQVIVNLVTNALDAMQDSDARVLQIDVTATAENTTRIRVRDTGCGVPPDRLSSIFNALDTSKENGMGMGLSLSRALAERHGGELWVETDVENGAAFILELPIYRKDSPAARQS